MSTFITISLLYHNGESRIKVVFPKREELITQIRQIEGRRWSKTNRCWHIPYTSEAYQSLRTAFQNYAIKIEGQIVKSSNEAKTTKKETVQQVQIQVITKKEQEKTTTPKEHSSIHILHPRFKTLHFGENSSYLVWGKKIIVNRLNNKYLAAYVPFDKKGWVNTIRSINGRKWIAEEKYWILPYVQETIAILKSLDAVHFNFEIDLNIPKAISIQFSSTSSTQKAPKVKAYDTLNEYQKRAIIALEEKLMLERKSWRTIKSYKYHLIDLFKFYPSMKPSQISTEQINKYMLYKIRGGKMAESTQGQLLNALVAFYTRVLRQEGKIKLLERPKKPKQLPNVFSKEEVQRLINSIENVKHRAIIALVYSAGLRKIELRQLRTSQILFERQLIFIKNSKGKKDRYVMLSPKIVLILKRYIEEYHPNNWLFEGQHGGQYSERSIQSIFTSAKYKSNVNPDVTFHGLRHSFATHLVERNVPLHVVKDLLGHNSIKTTEVYIHISNKYKKALQSPLDDLDIT